MSRNKATIAFDADDTLWHNERYFQISQSRFRDLLAPYSDPDHLSDRLLAAERRNLGHYGYGVKGFMLSMIETAIEVTAQKVPAEVISELLAVGQDILAHPIELLPGARDVIGELSETFTIVLITKGDLLDQERKLAQSGLGDLFDHVEIVSEKTAQTYHDIFARHGGGAAQALMVGNSMRSDIVPMIDAGGWGVHVPHDLLWDLEHAPAPTDSPRYHEIANLGQLPDLLAQITDS